MTKDEFYRLTVVVNHVFEWSGTVQQTDSREQRLNLTSGSRTYVVLETNNFVGSGSIRHQGHIKFQGGVQWVDVA